MVVGNPLRMSDITQRKRNGKKKNQTCWILNYVVLLWTIKSGIIIPLKHDIVFLCLVAEYTMDRTPRVRIITCNTRQCQWHCKIYLNSNKQVIFQLPTSHLSFPEKIMVQGIVSWRVWMPLWREELPEMIPRHRGWSPLELKRDRMCCYSATNFFICQTLFSLHLI